VRAALASPSGKLQLDNQVVNYIVNNLFADLFNRIWDQ